MGFLARTYKTEFQGSRDLMVVDKELDHLISELNGLLESAGLTSDGTFNTIVTNNIVINNNVTSNANLLVASRRLTDAQIKLWPTVAVELRLPDGSTSAPVLGFVCNLLRWAVTVDNRSGAYTGMTGCHLMLETGTVRQGHTGAFFATPLDAMFGNQGIWSFLSEPLPRSEPHIFDPAGANGQPWLSKLENSANLGGGNSANFATVTAYYVLTPVTTAVQSSALNWTTTGQLVAPPAAAGVSITPSGTTLTFSAWVEVDPATATDWLLTGISVVAGIQAPFLMQVGIGTAGNEVAIADILGFVDDSIDVVGNGYMIWPIPIDAIPSGSRVAVRLRKTGTNTTAWRAALTYLPVPTAGNVDSTSATPATFGFAVTTVPPGSWGGSSNWIPQGYASTSLLVWGARFTFDTDSVSEFEFDIGVGNPGTERIIGTIRSAMKDNTAVLGGGMHWLPFKPVIDGIIAGDLVSIRMRKSSGTASIDWQVTLLTSPTTDAAYPLLTQQASIAIPAGATGAIATTAGSSWADGSWVTVLAQLSEDTGIQTVAFFVDSSGSYELDLGYGAAGSETVAGTIRFQCFSGIIGDANHLALPYALVLPGHQRFAIRVRGTPTSQAVRVGFTATLSPSFDQRTSVTSGAFPAAANNKTVAGKNSAWGNSNWVQLVSSVGATDVFIHHICYAPGVSAVEFEIDLGVGAVASEVVLTTVRSWTAATSAGFAHIPLFPPVRVTAGTALSARFRKPGTDTSSWGFAVSYFGDVLA